MRKRLVYRADDLGYTKTYDEGFFKAVDNGIVTSADIMLDCPDSVAALKKLKDYPWISIGWHAGHLWGSPVAGADKVPNMVNEFGRFKWRKDKKLQDLVTFEDAYTEYKAQLELCISVLGRVPDTTSVMGNRPIDQARRQLCNEYGIVYDFCGQKRGGIFFTAREQYRNLNYNQSEALATKGRFDLTYFDAYYNQVEVVKRIRWEGDEIWRIGGHPGYLDDTILKESTCTIHRVKDIVDTTSQEMKDYIAEAHIELVNQRDVLYGTSEYQDHLRDINSPLWVGNFR